MDADTAGRRAVVAVGERIDEGLAHGVLGEQGRVLPLRIAFEEAGNAGRIANDEGVGVLEEGVQRSLEGLQVAVGVAGFVGVVAHGADANLRQAGRRIFRKQHVAAVGEAAVFGGGEILEHHERLRGIAEKGAANFLRFTDRGQDLGGVHVRGEVREGEAAFPAFRLDLAAHHDVPDGRAIGRLRGVAGAEVDGVAEGVRHVLARGHFDDEDRFAGERLNLHGDEGFRREAVVELLFQGRDGGGRRVHAEHLAALVDAADEVAAGGVEEAADDAAQQRGVPGAGLELDTLPLAEGEQLLDFVGLHAAPRSCGGRGPPAKFSWMNCSTS